MKISLNEVDDKPTYKGIWNDNTPSHYLNKLNQTKSKEPDMKNKTYKLF